MSVRLRRLKADYDRLCTIFTQQSRIRIKKTLGDPPEKYQIEYLVTGLEKKPSGELHSRSNFLVEIALTGSYPRMAPQCKMLTPVFHPNIAPHAICIGDHWAAGESLANLAIRIGEMLAFQSYNLKSPLNGEAAKWVDENKDKLPLDRFDFTSLLLVGEAISGAQAGSAAAATVCANCGKKAEVLTLQDGTTAQEQMHVCISNHVACSNCVMSCPICNGVVCLKCSLPVCTVCKTAVCQSCSYKCGSCQTVVCSNHQAKCLVCQSGRCSDCLVQCGLCGGNACLDHVRKVKFPDGSSLFACNNCKEMPLSSGAPVQSGVGSF